MMKRLLIPLLIVGTVPLAASPDYSAAIEAQEQRLLESPTAAAWNDLGALLMLAGDREQAAAAFGAALEYQPDNPEALYNLGVLALESDPNRARELLLGALERSEDGWTHYRLAQAFERLHRERRAVSHYARSFELDRSLLDPVVNPEIVGNRLALRSLLETRNPYERVRPSPRFVDTGEIRVLLLQDQMASPETTVESDPGSHADAAEEPGGEAIPSDGQDP